MVSRAGQIAEASDLIDAEAVARAYYELRPDPAIKEQRVVFGTSGHRGSSLNASFNESHIAAITLAIAEYRSAKGVTGPLFLGGDTHLLSGHALETARAVLQAQGIRVLVSLDGEFVPTPALSHAILKYNRPRKKDLADGIIVTPSHNPPADGGFKYNPPHGGPADSDATSWIAQRANEILESGEHVSRETRPGETGGCETHDFLTPYVESLTEIIDMEAIQKAGLKIAVHPLAGAAYAYWQTISKRYGLNLTVLGPKQDVTWSFMTLDWDEKIRMDPSSIDVMQTISNTQGFDLVLANDADADRFGVLVPGHGLINPNEMLAVSINHLLATRGGWPEKAMIGKTLVSSAMIDRVVAGRGRRLLEVPVGFKWFVAGLHEGGIVFGGEESAGASFLTMDARPWSTDKDGIIMCLLAAEIMAITGKSIDELYLELAAEFGESHYARVDSAATPAEKQVFGGLKPGEVSLTEIAGEKVLDIFDEVNGMPVGGLKIVTENSWCAIRPSGTEDVLKVYAESFLGADHLTALISEAQAFLAETLRVS